MAEESAQARPRRRYTRRSTSTGTTTARRRRASGSELVDNLNQMVSELIKENRRLKRQVERLSSKATGVGSAGIERGLRSIQRRVQRAVSSSTTTTRRRRTAASGNGRRTRRRRTQSSS